MGEARLHKIFAINVNLFWLGPATAELGTVRRALAPGGKLFLFYETPGPGRARQAAERLAAVLETEAFTEEERLTHGPRLVACVARPHAAP